MEHKLVRIGSRGSELALWQAHWIRRELVRLHPRVRTSVEIIRTTGDRILDSPLSGIGEKGLFTKEIEEALLEDRIDLAVHSLKDLPTELPRGLVIGAVSMREDVRDVFIPHPSNPVRTLLDQPPGATIATGSLRRKSQLLNLRPDFRTVDLRGNLNTRLKKLDESDWAGMVLARAGVARLGWTDRVGETLSVETILPAVGQGALAVEIREGDALTAGLIRSLEHWETERATCAERALLRGLEGGCQVPIGTFGIVEREGPGEYILRLTAAVGSLDGTTIIRGKVHGDPEEAEALGSRLATALLSGGADAILRSIRPEHAAEEARPSGLADQSADRGP